MYLWYWLVVSGGVNSWSWGWEISCGNSWSSKGISSSGNWSSGWSNSTICCSGDCLSWGNSWSSVDSWWWSSDSCDTTSESVWGVDSFFWESSIGCGGNSAGKWGSSLVSWSGNFLTIVTSWATSSDDAWSIGELGCSLVVSDWTSLNNGGSSSWWVDWAGVWGGDGSFHFQFGFIIKLNGYD